MLVDFIDVEKTTVAILKAYRDMEWKRIQSEQRIEQIDAQLASATPSYGSTPVSGGGNKTQEAWCAAIDQKTLAELGGKKAEEYFAQLEPCLDRLTPEEYDLILRRWIDYGEYNGIRSIMDNYHVEKTVAYERSNAALKRLAKLLFW